MEPRLHQRLQIHGRDRLSDPVGDRGHAEHSDPAAMRLGDLHRPDRRRKVGPRAHPIPDPVEVVPQIGLELVQRLPVHSRGTLVGRNPPIRLPHHRLGNRKRLVLGLWHVHLRFLPGPAAPVERTDIPGEPAPSLHPHPSEQALHSYYGPVRQRAPRPVLSAFGFCLGTLPLATSGPATPDDGFDARLLTFRARAADQAHAASTPGTTWPIHGHPPGSSRRKTQVPRFRCQLTYLSTPQQRTPTRITRTSASGTSSWSPPDAITPRLLPGRSPRRSSANAAPGRFSACPRRPTLEGQQASISCTAPPI